MVIAEKGEIIIDLMLFQLIDIPTLVASLLRMRLRSTGTEHRSSAYGENVVGVVHVGETAVVKINDV